MDDTKGATETVIAQKGCATDATDQPVANLFRSVPNAKYCCEPLLPRRDLAPAVTPIPQHYRSGAFVASDLDETTASKQKSICRGPKVILSSAQHRSLSHRDLFASERQMSSSSLSLKAPCRRGSMTRNSADASHETTTSRREAMELKQSADTRVPSLHKSCQVLPPTIHRGKSSSLRQSMKKQQSTPQLPIQSDVMLHMPNPVTKSRPFSQKQQSQKKHADASARRGLMTKTLQKQISVPYIKQDYFRSDGDRDRSEVNDCSPIPASKQAIPLRSYFQKTYNAQHDKDASAFPGLSTADVNWSPNSACQDTCASVSDVNLDKKQRPPSHSTHTVDTTLGSVTTATSALTPSTIHERLSSSINLHTTPSTDPLPGQDVRQIQQSQVELVFSPGRNAARPLLRTEQAEGATQSLAIRDMGLTAAPAGGQSDVNVSALATSAVSGFVVEATVGAATATSVNEIEWTPERTESLKQASNTIRGSSRSLQNGILLDRLPYFGESMLELKSSTLPADRKTKKQRSVARLLDGNCSDRKLKQVKHGVKKQLSVPTKLATECNSHESANGSPAEDCLLEERPIKSTKEGSASQMLFEAEFVSPGLVKSSSSGGKETAHLDLPSHPEYMAHACDSPVANGTESLHQTFLEQIMSARHSREMRALLFVPIALHSRAQVPITDISPTGKSSFIGTLASDIESFIELPPKKLTQTVLSLEGNSPLATSMADDYSTRQSYDVGGLPAWSNIAQLACDVTLTLKTDIGSRLRSRSTSFDPRDCVIVDHMPPKMADRRESMTRSQSAPGLCTDTSKRGSKVLARQEILFSTKCRSKHAQMAASQLDQSDGQNCRAYQAEKQTPTDAASSENTKIRTRLKLKVKASELGLSPRDLKSGAARCAEEKLAWSRDKTVRRNSKETDTRCRGNRSKGKHPTKRLSAEPVLETEDYASKANTIEKFMGKSSKHRSTSRCTGEKVRSECRRRSRTSESQRPGRVGRETIATEGENVKKIRKHRSKSRIVDGGDGAASDDRLVSCLSRRKMGSSSDFSYDHSKACCKYETASDMDMAAVATNSFSSELLTPHPKTGTSEAVAHVSSAKTNVKPDASAKIRKTPAARQWVDKDHIQLVRSTDCHVFFIGEVLDLPSEDQRSALQRTFSDITEDPMFRKVALAGITEEQISRLHKLGLKITEL